MIRAIFRQQTDDQGTIGVLQIDALRFFTIELPWRHNAQGKSCIPPGKYSVLWTKSPRMRRHTYEITNVPGRGGIRIHSGNLAGDVTQGYTSHSLGCPLLGERVGRINGQRAVLGSKSAVARFEKYLAGRPFILEVKTC